MPANNLREDRNLHNLYSQERISQNHWNFVAKESLFRYQAMPPVEAERFKKFLVEKQLKDCTSQFIERHPYLVTEDIDRRHPNGTQIVLEGDFYVYTPEELQELITRAYDAGIRTGLSQYRNSSTTASEKCGYCSNRVGVVPHSVGSRLVCDECYYKHKQEVEDNFYKMICPKDYAARIGKKASAMMVEKGLDEHIRKQIHYGEGTVRLDPSPSTIIHGIRVPSAWMDEISDKGGE